MSRIIKQIELDEARELVDTKNRFVDLAVRLRIVDDNGQSKGLYPGIFGGRWDTLLLRWVTPTPKDLRVLEWTVQAQQLPILLDRNIFVAVFAGRQAGKTHCDIQAAIIDWLRWPGRKIVTISQDYKASRDPEDTFRSLYAPWWRVKQNKTDRIYTLPHGGQYWFRSEEAIDSVRGPSLKTIHIVEAALQKHESFLTAIGCGVAAKDFQVRLDTTPKREVKWIRDVYQEWSTKPDHAVHHLDTMRNWRRNEKVIAAIIENTPADLADQELRGKLVDPVGRIWRLFKRSRHLREEPRLGDVTREFAWEKFRVRLSEKEPAHLIGWDFGKEAAAIAKVYRETYESAGPDGRPEQRKRYLLWWVGEAVDDATNTEHHAQVVADAWGTNAVVIHDAMGQHARVGGRGNERPGSDILKETGFAHVLPTDQRNPLVASRQDVFNRMLLNAKGVTTTYFVPGATPKLMDALENQRNGPSGKPLPEHGYEHIIDSATYLTWRAFPIRGVASANYRNAYADQAE